MWVKEYIHTHILVFILMAFKRFNSDLLLEFMTLKYTSGLTCRWGQVRGFMGRRAFKRCELVCFCGKFIMRCQLFSDSPAVWHGLWHGSFGFLTDTNRIRLCSLTGARLTSWAPGGAATRSHVCRRREESDRVQDEVCRSGGGFAGASPALDLFLKEVIYSRLLPQDPNISAQTKRSNLAKPKLINI